MNIGGGRMSEKRFRVNDFVKYDYSEIGEYVDENHTDRPLRNDEVCKLLNELHEENQQLKNDCGILVQSNQEYRKENERLRKENFFLDYWKKQAMTLLMQVRRLTSRMTDQEVKEFSKELEECISE